jgi:hypothetical protein
MSIDYYYLCSFQYLDLFPPFLLFACFLNLPST